MLLSKHTFLPRFAGARTTNKKGMRQKQTVSFMTQPRPASSRRPTRLLGLADEKEVNLRVSKAVKDNVVRKDSQLDTEGTRQTAAEHGNEHGCVQLLLGNSSNVMFGHHIDPNGVTQRNVFLDYFLCSSQ
jgi:hypothetical protein